MPAPAIPIVRQRTDRDIPLTAALLSNVYSTDGYPVEGVADPASWLRPPGVLNAWVAEDSNQDIVGHVLVNEPPQADPAVDKWVAQGGTAAQAAVLGRLFVARTAQGQGLGRRLTESAAQWANESGRRLVLLVIDKDRAAIRLYRRLGWQKTGSTEYVVGDHISFEGLLFVSPQPRA